MVPRLASTYLAEDVVVVPFGYNHVVPIDAVKFACESAALQMRMDDHAAVMMAVSSSRTTAAAVALCSWSCAN